MKVLVNLTNHPSQGWSPEQAEAAKKYGIVADMPFPEVNPELSSIEVRKLAENFVKSNFSSNDAENVTVHIMGEMTFVWNAVYWLKQMGIHCIASTTERVVQELGDGKKVSTFQFKQFRTY